MNMSQIESAINTDSPSWKRKIVRLIVFFLVVPYILIGLLIFFAQRKIIYPASMSPPLDARLAKLPNGQVHNVTVTTEDGLALHGWYYLPDGNTALSEDELQREMETAERIVIFFPGNGGKRSNRSTWHQGFTQENCHLLTFDYRGYAENPGSPSEEALLADARSIWNFLTIEHNVPARKIVLYGESLGGGVAIGLASQLCQEDSQNSPAAIIVRSTFSSIEDVASESLPIYPISLMLKDHFRSYDRIAYVTCPILMSHGGRDSTIPIRFGKKLFDHAPETSESGIKKRFLEYPVAGHNNLYISDFKTEILELFEQISVDIH